MKTGKLIVFEGIEASGKGLQAKKAAAYLENRSLKVLLMQEPGSTLYGLACRALLKHPQKMIGTALHILANKNDLPGGQSISEIQTIYNAGLANDFERSALTEIFLFEAARASYYQEIVEPCLRQGIWVISDRSPTCTLAYQAAGRAPGNLLISLFVSTCNLVATNGQEPDMAFFLDITIETMWMRLAKECPKKMAFFEKQFQKDPEFLKRVAAAYREIASRTEYFWVIDGEQPADKVAADIRKELDALIKQNRKQTPKRPSEKTTKVANQKGKTNHV